MSSLEEDIRQKLMHLLKDEEEKTDLEDLAVLSRIGMKMSSANSYNLDADAISASSTALIDLGLRLSEATNHGALKEIILHNLSGYCILMAINDEYMVFGGLSAIYRIGYYLGYVRELAKKINIIISGNQVTKMVLTLEDSELKKIRKQKKEEEIEEEPAIIKPSIEEDKAALDNLLGFLDDWEKEGADIEDLEQESSSNIVSIPKSIIADVKTFESSPQTIDQTTAKSDFQVYDDEVPPVPLEDYTPMEVEEGQPEEMKPMPPTEEFAQEYAEPTVPIPSLEIPQEEKTTSGKLPTLDDLVPPDFEAEAASEYDTEFILEEESESLEAVLKDLGWDIDEE